MSGAPGASFAEVLTDQLGPGFDVRTRGCGGSSSLDWTLSNRGGLCGGVGFFPRGLYGSLARPLLPADVVVLMLGTNDAIGFFEPMPVERDVYSAAMQEIVSNVLAHGGSQVALMIPPMHPSSADANVRLMGYRQALLEICRAEDQATCGPDLSSLLGSQDFSRGNLHPNAMGHFRIGEALAPVVRSLAVPEPTTRVLLLMCACAWRIVRRKEPDG